MSEILSTKSCAKGASASGGEIQNKFQYSKIQTLPGTVALDIFNIRVWDLFDILIFEFGIFPQESWYYVTSLGKLASRFR